MEPRDTACLDALSWFESLTRLGAWTMSEAPLENVLRLAYSLAALAPPPFYALAACTLDETAFDELLQRQAFEAAAIALIGTALRYEVVSCAGAASPATVRIWLNGDTGETLVTSDTLPAALVRAWITFMLGLGQATGSSHRSA